MICCVFKPDRADLDCCGSYLELLFRLAMRRGRVKVLLNQCKAPGALLEEEVVEILKPDLSIQYDSSLRAMCQ